METCKGSCALHKQDINAGALFLKKQFLEKETDCFAVYSLPRAKGRHQGLPGTPRALPWVY